MTLPKQTKYWLFGIIALLVSLFWGAMTEQHPQVGFDSFGFYALWGLFSSIVLILISKLFALCIKRKDTYYDN